MVATGTLCLLAGCSGADGFQFHDRDARMSRDDMRKALAVRTAAETKPPEVPIPALAPLAEPVETTQPSAVRLLTVRSDGSASVRDLLLGLARVTGTDIDIDPAVQGSVLLTATDRPLLEIVERIAERANLRWEFRNGYLRVEPDVPMLRSYRVDYLNLVRQTQSTVSTTASVTSAGGGSSAGSDNGSASSVQGHGESDFWKELDANLTNLLGIEATPVGATEAAAGDAGVPGPAASRKSRPPKTVQAALEAVTGGDETAAAEDTAADGDEDSETADAAPVASPRAPAPAAAKEIKPSFSINRQAGILNVRATERQHRLVGAYLRNLRRNVSAQVLIEARVVQVTLNDEFESGINWRSLFGGVFETGGSFGTIVAEPPFSSSSLPTAGRATFALSNNDISAVASLVQRFGTVRTLSSPRVTVVQNQTAVLKVAENQVFFRLEYQTQQSQQGGLSTTTVSSTLNTVPVGVIITVQPSINPDTERVALAVRPTVTRIVDYVDDPAVSIASNNQVTSRVPVVAVQELDSVVNMGSGQVVVMGGLMQDSTSSTDEGLPGASGVPLLGTLFKSREDATAKSELVVFLKATIVKGSALDGYDNEMYQTFGQGRRGM